jgi:hypothetical protein
MCPLSQGVRGFVKGAVRGAISFVVLPTSGFFNMASNTASSVRNLVNPATELVRTCRSPYHVLFVS